MPITQPRRGAGRARRVATLVAVFVVAMIIGAALGWFVSAWSHRTLEERARNAAEDVRHRGQQLTR